MKKKTQLRINNRSGFTLVEVILVTAMLAVFSILAGTILRDIYGLTQLNRDQLETETDLTFTMRYLSKLFKDAGPSFNYVIGNLDDSGREFFDQIDDVSTAGWSQAEYSRTLTLDPKLNRLHFYFLTFNSDQKDQVFYNPVNAYRVPEPNMQMNVSAPLVYSALNNNNVVSRFAPDIWVNNSLLMLKVPIPLRFVAVDGTVNMNLPPRMHSFLGRVRGSDLTADNFAGHVSGNHPVTNLPVPNVDSFLRTVPTVGGASPVVELVALRGYRISLERRSQSNQYDLYTYEYHNGQFDRPFLVATKVNAVTFTRESVGLPLIRINVAIEKSKRK